MTKKAAAARTEVFVSKLGLTGRIAVAGMGIIGLVGLAIAAQNLALIVHGGAPIWVTLLFVVVGLLIAFFAVMQLRPVLAAAGTVYTVTPAALDIQRRFGVRHESLPWATFVRVSREMHPSLRPPGIIVETADRRIVIHGLTLSRPQMEALYRAICTRAPARACG
jgi:membrane protein YdbS with pleckstrin-like domain